MRQIAGALMFFTVNKVDMEQSSCGIYMSKVEMHAPMTAIKQAKDMSCPINVNKEHLYLGTQVT